MFIFWSRPRCCLDTNGAWTRVKIRIDHTRWCVEVSPMTFGRGTLSVELRSIRVGPDDKTDWGESSTEYLDETFFVKRASIIHCSLNGSRRKRKNEHWYINIDNTGKIVSSLAIWCGILWPMRIVQTIVWARNATAICLPVHNFPRIATLFPILLDKGSVYSGVSLQYVWVPWWIPE